MQAKNECHAVMRELVDPRYTAAQLRFAFLVLVEQEAMPWTLFNAFSNDLMKDFLDRRMSPDVARIKLLHVLRFAWADAGFDPTRWPLEGTDLEQSGQQTGASTDDIVQAQTAWQLVRRDDDQVKAANGVMSRLRNEESVFCFRTRQGWKWQIHLGFLSNISSSGGKLFFAERGHDRAGWRAITRRGNGTLCVQNPFER